MKIAFDLRRIKNPGIGRYMKCLVEAIISRAPENEYLLIMPRDAVDAVNVPQQRVKKISPGLRYYSIREQFELPRILRRERVDLLHSPHFNLPLFRPCPTVVTIHDVIYLACPEDLASRLGRFYYKMMMGASVRLADRIITDSQYSKQDIVRYLNADPAKVEVIYPGVDEGFRPRPDPRQAQDALTRYGIRGEYILYTGIYKKRKNHTGLLRAFRHLTSRGYKAQLVIAGPLQEGEQELRTLAGQLGLADDVVLAGFVSDDDLRALYTGARVYACPSLYEGFGFTVLEAMSCGVPVVCAPETSLPEVAGNAALFADARSPEAFGDALLRACRDLDLRDQLTASARTNLERFAWARAADQTLAAYQQALGALVTGTAYA
jgi:glycosyltransferase involved in cell wall biosynthesis